VGTQERSEPKRAAGYIRVSQERAARNGYGLDVQDRDIRKHADYKGWNLGEVYREEGVSGYKRERPALDRLLADAKAGHFSVVIFPSIDRAGRSVKDVIEIDAMLRSGGVEIVFLREGIDTSTPTGELYRNIMAAVAQFEGKLTCERLTKGRRLKASEGGYIGGWVPYGYRVNDEGDYEVVPEQAEVVKRIFGWRRRGKSLRWIADKLGRQLAPTQKGGSWRPATIQRILGNEFYAGLVQGDGEVVRGRHQPVVSERLFQIVQVC